MEQPRLLFFSMDNDFCKYYYKTYVAKFAQHTLVINLSSQEPRNKKVAMDFGIRTAPSLILLDEDGFELKSWRGGEEPHLGLINTEIGMDAALKDDGQS